MVKISPNTSFRDRKISVMTTKLVYFDSDYISMFEPNDTPIERFIFRSEDMEFRVIRCDQMNDGIVVYYGRIGDENAACVMLEPVVGEMLYQKTLKAIIENPQYAFNLEFSL